jgi:glycosyltransferase involved in cell wall biosynthesis
VVLFRKMVLIVIYRVLLISIFLVKDGFLRSVQDLVFLYELLIASLFMFHFLIFFLVRFLWRCVNLMHKKIDLLLWSLNGEKTLPLCLSSIRRAIPNKFVNRRIVVDGGSEDKTVEIATRYGWEVVSSDRGIARQANVGLGMVETDVFATFEQDILLCPEWFYCVRDWIEGSKVAVVNGARFSKNKVLRSIEECSLRRGVGNNISLDNNLLKTDVIRELGGFNEHFKSSVDRDLRDRVELHGFKWVFCDWVVSDHLKFSFVENVKHCYTIVDDYPEDMGLLGNVGRLAFGPFRGLDVACKFGCPSAVFLYPYMRLYKLLGMVRKGLV